MITEIGFLEPGLKITKLNCIRDSNEEFSDSTDSEEEISETDTIIYAISNSEDLSYIQFYIKNTNNFYIHHDIITTDTITTSFYHNKKIYTAGFMNTINSYNVFDFNPIAPEDVYEGHEGTINKIRLKKDIYSCSDDKSIRQFDLVTKKMVNVISFDYEVKNFYFYGDLFITLDENSIYLGDKLFCNENEITFSMLEGDNLHFADSQGSYKVYNILEKKITREVKICKEDINSFVLFRDIAYFCSDKTLYKLLQSGVIEKREYENELIYITINTEHKYIVIGDIKDKILFAEIE